MKQTEEKVKGGRKRTHLIKVYLSDDEYEKLCRDAATFKRDKSKYLRLLIEWIEPVAPPSVEVKEFTRELHNPPYSQMGGWITKNMCYLILC